MARPSNPKENRTCPNCLNIFEVQSWKVKIYCGRQCAQEYTKSKNRDWLDKRDITNMEVYGVKSPLENKQVLQNYKDSIIKKYGVENPFLVKEFRDKADNTILEKYGFRYANQNKHIAQKISNSIKGKEKDRTNFVELKWDKLELFCKETDITPQFDKQFLLDNKVEEQIKFIFKCNKCSNIMSVSLDNGYLPSCVCSNYRGYSLIEEEISKFIINNYKNEVRLKVRGVLPKNFEIDILIEDLNLGIEVNGIYWHSESMGKYRDYHLYKTEKCLDKGIQLLHIFDNEWLYKKPIIQSIILNKLGLTPNKVYARKCEIKEVSNSHTKEFLLENHRQGYCPSKHNIGLYNNDELVSIMTFGKNRFKQDGKFELLRFCNKLNTNVIGGASKLLKYFNIIINTKGTDIISFADRRYSIGGLYENIGFEFESFSKPSYFYWKNTHILNRMSCQKHKLEKLLPLFDPNLSEYENMKLNKWNRVWDCGNYKFIYKNKKDLNKRS